MAIPIVGWTLSPNLWEAWEQVVFSPLVLKFAECNKFFEVQRRASDFAIGGILIQDGWPLHMRAWSSMDLKRDDQLMRNNPSPYCMPWRCGNTSWGCTIPRCTRTMFPLSIWRHKCKWTPKFWWHGPLAFMKMDLIHKVGHDNIRLYLIYRGSSKL